jgi:hypothetical protein
VIALISWCDISAARLVTNAIGGRAFQHVWKIQTSSDLIQLASRPQKVCVAPECRRNERFLSGQFHQQRLGIAAFRKCRRVRRCSQQFSFFTPA